MACARLPGAAATAAGIAGAAVTSLVRFNQVFLAMVIALGLAPLSGVESLAIIIPSPHIHIPEF